jgi:hypothetical protein
MRAAKARFGAKFGKVLDLLAVVIALLLLFGGLHWFAQYDSARLPPQR